MSFDLDVLLTDFTCKTWIIVRLRQPTISIRQSKTNTGSVSWPIVLSPWSRWHIRDPKAWQPARLCTSTEQLRLEDSSVARVSDKLAVGAGKVMPESHLFSQLASSAYIVTCFSIRSSSLQSEFRRSRDGQLRKVHRSG